MAVVTDDRFDTLDPEQMRQVLLELMAEVARKDELIAQRQREMDLSKRPGKSCGPGRRWCEGPACERPWPQDHRQTVRGAFEAERGHLLPLPSHDWVLGERLAAAVGKTPYVRFDLNDYSVPHTHVQRTLAVVADEQQVRIFDNPMELACHTRCWDRGQQIKNPAHVQALVADKRQARQHRGYDQLAQAAPASAQLLQMAAGLPPPIPLILPEHVARRDAPVHPHALESYDRHGRHPEHRPEDCAED